MITNMKRIDCHTHCGISSSWDEGDKYPNCCLVTDLMERLHQHHFDGAIVFPLPSAQYAADRPPVPGIVPYLRENQRLVNETEQLRHPNLTLLPFAMFSLNGFMEEQLGWIQKAADTGRIFGLKYYPDMDKIHVSELFTRGRPFLDILMQYNLPLTIHIGEHSALKGGFSDPMVIVNQAAQFPKLRVCIAHMGHFRKNVIEQVLHHRIHNVFFDVSPLLHLCDVRTVNKSDLVLDLPYQHPIQVLQQVADLLPDQLLWGSDYPYSFTCNLNASNHNKDFMSFRLSDYMDTLMAIPKQKADQLCRVNPIRFLKGDLL